MCFSTEFFFEMKLVVEMEWERISKLAFHWVKYVLSWLASNLGGNAEITVTQFHVAIVIYRFAIHTGTSLLTNEDSLKLLQFNWDDKQILSLYTNESQFFLAENCWRKHVVLIISSWLFNKLSFKLKIIFQCLKFLFFTVLQHVLGFKGLFCRII